MMNKAPDEADALAEGFRLPPDRITEPCLTYMARIMELRRFNGFYFNFVKTSQIFKDVISRDGKTHVTQRELEVVSYNYSDQRPLINQIMLSRAVESFELYLTTILRDIFLAKPEMLKSEGSIEISTVVESGNYEELILRIVERKVHEVSYKPLSDLRKFIRSWTGIDLFLNEDVFAATLVASELRNLIAHSDGKINDLFRMRTKGVNMQLQISGAGRIIIDDDWLRRASYTLDGLVFRFDELVAEKFNLHTLNRAGAFLLRS